MPYTPLKLGSFTESKEALSTTLNKVDYMLQDLYNVTYEGDLSAIGQNVVPDIDALRNIGSLDHQWKSLYLANNGLVISGTEIGVDIDGNLTVNGTVVGTGTTLPDQANNSGKFLSTDGAILSWQSVPSSYELPVASGLTLGGIKIGSNLSIDISGVVTANQATFRSISVTGQADVEASTATSALTLIAGTNVTITTDSINDSITISASGGGGGTSYDQSLNTTDNVEFVSVTAGEFISTSTGVPTLTSATNINLQAANVVAVTTSPFRLASLTTAQRNALVAVNGDMIYNSTLNKLQGYQNGTWINLDGTA